MDRSATHKTTAYRAFVINDKGHLGGVPKIIDALDDGDAARQAETLADWVAIEVWEGARLVVRLPPHYRGMPAPHF